MPEIQELLNRNRQWAKEQTNRDPEFFTRLSKQQKPEYLWIGCSDSRVPANEIVGMAPGELFVHRNIANVVNHTDFNCLSVMQFAVEVLQVKHIIVCGHYGCGGVRAALSHDEFGFVDNWLRAIKEIYIKYQGDLDQLDEKSRVRRLCELNVMEQTINLAKTKCVQRAWDHGQDLKIHGWIYDIADGIIHDLCVDMHCRDTVPEIFHILGKRIVR
ncbi:carbonate dehydratase [Hahella sp. CCB-MM4]|uniref:carbonate dehydratase n=1 Tax=Hahella sp. (strain CCB-MM4) TaxID=1926491 RepID=UPI000B9A47C3|nr:carbonate dehydratase [Hahella sp. CCB-MM4]OZG73830.1 carbonate dehydratase [Hahella sp. CCB-MM4]